MNYRTLNNGLWFLFCWNVGIGFLLWFLLGKVDSLAIAFFLVAAIIGVVGMTLSLINLWKN